MKNGSAMFSGKFQTDMCQGPIFSRIVLFTVPLILTFMLSIAFNAVDLVIIGNFADSESVAAIGATMSYNTMLFCLFFGLSSGTNVMVSRFFGAGDQERLGKAVHTSLLLAVTCGIALGLVGFFLMKPVFTLMKIPDNIMPKACLYYGICLCSVPFSLLSSFGFSILRAMGDTIHPLFFLTAAGVVNILLNLFFVIVMKMDVGGVAVATVIAHFVSAALVIRTLRKSGNGSQLRFRRLCWDFPILKEILHVGIPAGIQSCCFGLANMVVASSVNSFGDKAIAGITAAITLEGIVQTSDEAFFQTSTTFISQNYGAHKFRRIRTGIIYCYVTAFMISLVTGFLFYFFGPELLNMVNPDPEAIRWGMIRVKIVFTTAALCSVMDVACASLRGLNYAVTSMLVSLFGTCFFRIFWIFTVFRHYRTMESLLMSYPVSWALVWLVNGSILIFVYRKLVRSFPE